MKTPGLHYLSELSLVITFPTVLKGASANLLNYGDLGLRGCIILGVNGSRWGRGVLITYFIMR